MRFATKFMSLPFWNAEFEMRVARPSNSIENGFSIARQSRPSQDAVSMKIRFVPAVVVLFSAVLIGGATLSPARGGVVYGNLGPAGATPLGTTNTDLGTGDPLAPNWIAQGFKTGPNSTALTVNSVTVGLFATDSGTIPITVSIYAKSNEGNFPEASPLFTSSPTNVGGTAKYVFGFSNAILSPNTTYWIVPNDGSWYHNTGSPAGPIEQNVSGYTYVDTLESLSTSGTPSGPWTDEEVSARYSVSIQAVPEPAALGLIAGGVAGLFGLCRRRLAGR